MENARHGGNAIDVARMHGLPISEVLDFSASLNDFIPESEMPHPHDGNLITAYPGSDESLRINLAKYSAVSPENILPGPGLSYFIYRIAELFSGRKSLLVRPAFSEYYRAFKVHGMEISSCPAASIMDMLPEIRQRKFSIVCINRPDTPTGNLLDRDDLMELSVACSEGKAYLFIDEAFIDFLPAEERDFSAELLRRNSHVVLGRSLTKIFSTPSLRIGYLIGSRDFLTRVENLMEPWTLGNHIIETFSRIDFHSLDKYSRIVNEERQFLIRSLNSMGFQVVGNPCANYATFRVPYGIKVPELDNFLQKRGIIVRTLEDFPDFGKEFIRISVKRREKTEILMSAFRDYMGRNRAGPREQ